MAPNLKNFTLLSDSLCDLEVIRPKEALNQQSLTQELKTVNSDDYWAWTSEPDRTADLFSADHLEENLTNTSTSESDRTVDLSADHLEENLTHDSTSESDNTADLSADHLKENLTNDSTSESDHTADLSDHLEENLTNDSSLESDRTADLFSADHLEKNLTKDSRRRASAVVFHEVQIRHYEQTMGDNPCVSYGPPISLDWGYVEVEPIDLDEYENSRRPRRNTRQLLLNQYSRKNLLIWRLGATEEEMKAVEKEVNKIKSQRSLTKALLPAQKLEEVFQSLARKTKRLACRRV
jgi:hypothetical protein